MVLVTVKLRLKVTKVKTLALVAVFDLDLKGVKLLYSDVYQNVDSLTFIVKNLQQ